MEDDKIKDLFSNFEPELSSSSQFMQRLQQNMNAIEFVKQQNAAMKRRNRMAVLIALVCGFAMGVVLTLAYPLMGDWISTVSISLPFLNINTLQLNYQPLGWLFFALASGITALNAYEIALAKLPRPKSPQAA